MNANYLSRRQFLQFSAMAGGALALAACARVAARRGAVSMLG